MVLAEVHIRDALATDLESLLALMREYYEFDGLAFDEVRARRALANLLENDTFGHVWLIVDAGVAIGYAAVTLGYSLEYLGRDAFVDEIYLRASHRGRGIGSRMLAVIENACRAAGVQALHLEVRRGNVDAQRAYLKAGFEHRDRYLLTKRISPVVVEQGRSPSSRS